MTQLTLEIKDAALRYLSSRSRTVFEMTKYLQEKGFSAEAAALLTEEFQALGYLDDQRYCREYFRYGFGKGKGKKRVFYELREKGVDPNLVEIAFEDYLAEEGTDYDERGRALAEAEKVLRMADLTREDALSEKVLARIGRKLQSKGYSGDIIYSVLGELRGRYTL